MEKTQSTQPVADAPVEPAPLKSRKAGKRNVKVILGGIGIILISVAASFLGVWLLIANGIIKLDASRAITDNSQTIVMQQGEVIAEVFNKVSPSTVAIMTEATSTGGANNYFSSQQVSEGAGSGIIVSKDGYIMTNKHVVPDGIKTVQVVTHDGKEYTDVTVVGRDPSNDIAFLKIANVNDLTPAQIGDSNQVTPGQQVIAIGNALGIFRNSVTSGIVSGVGRPLTASDETGMATEQLEDMFQTDAAINPGNSGGPLVNLKGEVIGMNTAISSDGQAIGFAIPINAAKAEIASVIAKGKIIKAYVGVRFISITPEVAKQMNLKVTDGALVAGGAGQPAIISGSPAEKAGLKSGDIITKVNGVQVQAGRGLATLLSQYIPGDKVELTVLRDGKEQKNTVTLAEYPQ